MRSACRGDSRVAIAALTRSFSVLCTCVLLGVTDETVALAGTRPPFRNFSFVLEPNDTVAVLGQNVQLPCKALFEGRPPTVISWMRHGELLSIWTSVQSRRILLENGSLLITDVGHNDPLPDQGTYRCVAEVLDSGVNLRIATPQAKVEIASLPRQFEREPRSLTLNVGDTAVFACKISSRPPATYSWVKEDGSRLVEVGSGNNNRVRSYPDDGVLEIRSVASTDLGNYRCRASVASVGVRMSEPARLQLVSSRASANASLPEFVIRPWDTTVREGNAVTLFCAANGATDGGLPPTTHWLKEGSTVEVNSTGRVSIVGAGHLRIFNVSETDAGVYTCRAVNSEDSVDADASLRVLVPPRLIKKPVNTYAHKDEDIEFECMAYGIPPPRVYWLKDSEEFTPDDYFRVIPGRGLRIVGLMEADSGTYQCLAESDAGRTHAIAQLIVLAGDAASAPSPPQLPVGQPATAMTSTTLAATVALPQQSPAAGDRPPAPVALTAPATTTSSVSLLWQPPDQDGSAAATTEAYHITAKEADSSRLRAANVSTTSYTWSSLKPNTVYEFRVFSQNSAGQSSRTAAELTVRTRPELAVPRAPSSFKAFAFSSTEIRASWMAPPAAGGGQSPLLYKVYYYWSDQSKEQSINTSATSVVLERLNIYTDYYLRVAAVNLIGEGVPTEEVVIRTLSALPGAAPQNITVEATGTSTLLVQWQPPPADQHNGIITGYKLRYKERDQFGPADKITTDGNARSYEISGLEPGDTYLVRVAATNINGTGDYTPWFTATTYRVDFDESRPPGKPLYIHTKAFATEMIVNWGPPGGEIVVRGYRLGYGEITPDERWTDLEASDRYHTLKDLKPTQSYVIQLLAYNRAGEGFPIMAQELTREQSAAASSTAESPVELTPPMEVKALVLSPTSVLVLWHDNSLGSNQRVSDNRYYTVKYTALTGSMRKTKTINSTDLSIIVDSLRPYTKYEFAVKVVKGKRESLYSFNQRNTTFESAPGSPPRDLTITASDTAPNELVVSWQPPLKANGRLNSYLVYYATENKPDMKLWVMEPVAGDRLNKRIQRVTPDTTYFFKIEAHNSKGRGPMSQTEVFRTPKADGTGGGGIVVSQDARVIGGGSELSGDKSRDGGTGSAAELELVSRTSGATNGVSADTMWIVIGCVGAVTVVAIVALVVVLCRRHVLSPERKNKRAGLKQANKMVVRGTLKDQPPDLWIHHELKPLDRSMGPGSLSAAALGGADCGTAEPDELIPMLDPNQRYDIDQSMSVGGDTYIDSYSSLGRNSRPVFVTAHSGLREGMPRAAVPPMNSAVDALQSRTPYPRTQYGSGARVYVGDSSVASMTAVSSSDVSGLCRQQSYLPQLVSPGLPPEGRVHPLRSFNIPGPPPVTPPCVQAIPKHIVHPQPSSPYKSNATKSSNIYVMDPCENGSLKRVPRSEVSSMTAVTARPPDMLSYNHDDVIDLRKTHSTEQLNEETANLEVIIRDINDLRRDLE